MNLRAAVPALLGLGMLLTVSVFILGRPAPVTGQQSHAGHGGSHHAMTPDAMRQWSESWWASHPRVGISSGGAPAATFTVSGFQFDSDDNPGTQVDTARITVGESVLWQWIDGFHSITSGSGEKDPNAGAVFDQPSDADNEQFTFTFNSAGTFPFFCRPHDFTGMRGVVVVSSATGAEPLSGGRIGFTNPPRPNPTRTGIGFGFSLRESGRARARVFDVRGRLVAVVLDRDLTVGPHGAAWNGRTVGGGIAPAGVYYVRLQLPGFDGARRFVIAR